MGNAMRRLAIVGAIAALSLAAIALLVGREERPASAGFCPGDIHVTRQVQVWYGTLSGPGVDANTTAIELTDKITENLRQQIVADPGVDQRVRDDSLAPWVENINLNDVTWANGAEENFPAENNLRNDLTVAASPSGAVTFGSPTAEYSHTYALHDTLACTGPTTQTYYRYEALVTFNALDATFNPFTPSASPSPTPSPTPSASPSPTPTPTLTPTPTPTPTPTTAASASATATQTPTQGPSASPCQTIDDCTVGGDANCDLSVNLEDVAAVLADVGGIESTPCPTSANVKCDDNLDGRDALLILTKEAGLTAAVPGGCKLIG